MKQLEKEFEGIGEMKNFHFKQIKESEKAFLYEVTQKEYAQIHFEVFEKKTSKDGEGIIGGVNVKFEAKVRYPNSKNFGDWAFCITDYDKALCKFDELTNKPDKVII